MPDQSTTNTEAKAPTGDIKLFIDAFNTDFDNLIKSLLESQQNYKNVYADAIKLTQPRHGSWPNDPKVVTMGDLFKYVFPDINSDVKNKPDRGSMEYASWLKDMDGTSNNSIDIIGKMYETINSGIDSNVKIKDYQELKKPGITNPNLYSPGQYYFDVFMMLMLSENGPLKNPSEANGGNRAFGGDVIQGYSFLKTHGGSASVSYFDPSDEIELSKHNDETDPKFDYYEFYQVLSSGYSSVNIRDRVKSLTGIDIRIGDDDETPSKSFPSLKKQYRSGVTAELEKDPKFNSERGTSVEVGYATIWGPPGNFIGNYEHILLYKAFVQAGDNYKSVVLPLREKREEPAPEPTPSPLVKVVEPTSVSEVQFKFNVEKTDTFIVVGGTVSPPLELTIVPNDGIEYIFDNTYRDQDDLGEEYQEGEFIGEDESLELSQASETYDNLQSELPPNATGSTLNINDSNINYNDPSFKGGAWKNFDISTAVSKISGTSYKPNAKFVESLKKVLFLIKNDEQITDLREGAYLLGTAYAESGYSLQRWEADYACTGAGIPYGPAGPCSKATNYYRSSSGKKNYYTLGTDSKGQCYFGRGLIQLTGKGNYEKYGKLIGADLLGNGDLAMDPVNSYKVASVYMRGRTFEHVLANNLTKARKSVNGGTKGIDHVNGAYNAWIDVLKNSKNSTTA